MISPGRSQLSIVCQCKLLCSGRSGVYYRPVPANDNSLMLMRQIDEQFLETPYYGTRQMTRHLQRQGHAIGRKRVRRLMRKMGLAAIYQNEEVPFVRTGRHIILCCSFSNYRVHSFLSVLGEAS